MAQPRHAERGRRIGNGGLWVVHFVQIAFGNDGLVRVFAVAKLENQIVRHVVDAGVDGAGGADGVNIVVRNFCDDVFFQRVGEGVVGGLFNFGDGQVRVGHLQWSKNLFANAAFPAEAGELSFEVAHGHDGEIVVLVGAAKAFVGLELVDTADEVLAGEVRGIPNEVVARQTGAMREEVAGSGLLAGDGIAHLKFGEIAADGFVPIDFAFVFQNGESQSGKGFGD